MFGKVYMSIAKLGLSRESLNIFSYMIIKIVKYMARRKPFERYKLYWLPRFTNKTN